VKDREAQLLWSLSVVVLLAGYFLVYRTFEDQIAARFGATSDVVDVLRRNDAVLARRPALETLNKKLLSALHSIALRSDRSAIVALFVRETARVAAVHHLAVLSIEGPRGDGRLPTRTLPTVAGTTQTSSLTAPSPPLFDSVPLDITLHGSYADLLGAIRDLSHVRVLAEIELVSIERTPAPGNAHPLTAHLHVNLDRLTSVAPKAPGLTEGHPRAIDPA